MGDCRQMCLKCSLVGLLVGLVIGAGIGWASFPSLPGTNPGVSTPTPTPSVPNPRPAPAGVVWRDSSPRDCAIGPAEQRFQGVNLELQHPNGTVIRMATTNANGEYAFASPVEGRLVYTVTVTNPPEDPACDFDDHITTGSPSTPNVAEVLVPLVGNTPKVDFGYLPKP